MGEVVRYVTWLCFHRDKACLTMPVFISPYRSCLIYHKLPKTMALDTDIDTDIDTQTHTNMPVA